MDFVKPTLFKLMCSKHNEHIKSVNFIQISKKKTNVFNLHA